MAYAALPHPAAGRDDHPQDKAEDFDRDTEASLIRIR